MFPTAVPEVKFEQWKHLKSPPSPSPSVGSHGSSECESIETSPMAHRPDSVGAVGTQIRYAHAPYDFEKPFRLISTTPITHPSRVLWLHSPLLGRCDYFPFPQTVQTHEPLSSIHSSQGSGETRLFIGQLPSNINSMVLDWMCEVFVKPYVSFLISGPLLYGMEMIIDWTTRKSKHCIHVHTPSHMTQTVIAALDGRMLFDNYGVWYASNKSQRDVLGRYCAEFLVQNSHGHCRRAIVVQEAVSTFKRRSH